MNCPICDVEMVLARATDFGPQYFYCRTCKKELREMEVPALECAHGCKPDDGCVASRCSIHGCGPLPTGAFMSEAQKVGRLIRYKDGCAIPIRNELSHVIPSSLMLQALKALEIEYGELKASVYNIHDEFIFTVDTTKEEKSSRGKIAEILSRYGFSVSRETAAKMIEDEDTQPDRESQEDENDSEESDQ